MDCDMFLEITELGLDVVFEIIVLAWVLSITLHTTPAQRP